MLWRAINYLTLIQVCGISVVILLLQSEMEWWEIGSEGGAEDVSTTHL